jgi:large subunit ribosomal protein L4
MALDAPVYNMAGEEVRRHQLPEEVFGVEPNEAVMHQALVRQMANARQGTHKTQNRSDVSRTSSKWYRQKGTGRARHGARTANLFVGGAVAHGPIQRDYKQRMPRRMRRLALRSALSVKAAEGAIALMEDLVMDAPRTRDFEDLVFRVCDGEPTLVVLADRNDEVERSIRNLPHVRYLRADYLNVRDLLGSERLMLELEAVEGIVARLGGGAANGGEGDASD